MAELTKYQKKTASQVVAVQLDLETDGLTYQKWGGTQTCKAGDWIVNNDGDVYTVDRETFARTYGAVSSGIYEKVAPVWARLAEQPGQIATPFFDHGPEDLVVDLGSRLVGQTANHFADVGSQ